MLMPLDCSSLQQIAHKISLVQDCDVVRSGALRLCTPFVYPNGSNIDVFLSHAPGALFENYVLSDYGQTAMYLNNALVKLGSTDRKRQILNDICAELGIKHRQGVFSVEIEGKEASDISDAILRLSQACIRISDFASHQRMRSANPFRDDVEEFFEAAGYPCEPDVKLAGPYGRDVKIDLQVNGPQPVLCLMLAAMNESAAHASANEIFRRWSDLKLSMQEPDFKFVTVYNSASRAIRSDDIQRLASESEVISYPEQQDALLEAVAT